MKILIACDSFKDALPAVAVCRAIERGLHLSYPTVRTKIFPMGDGGEGTAEILTFHSGGSSCAVQVHDPLFRPVQATYGLSGDGKTAFIEMAVASGLQLLKPEERNPMNTTTLGTGELIMDAIKRGAKKIILGIGGSSTNDMGLGMATALGYEFADEAGQPLSPVGGNLGRVTQLEDSAIKFAKGEYQFEVICDVDNPLYGEHGAAFVYGQQKGADKAGIVALDKGMRNMALILAQKYYQDFAYQPGAGAAGGLGAGCMAFLGARLRPGIDTVMELTDFEKRLLDSDLVITGEGRLDAQTLHGKLIFGITQRAKQYNVPVVAFCGSLELTPDQMNAIGLRAAFSISNGPQALADALKNTEQLLENTAFQVMQLLHD